MPDHKPDDELIIRLHPIGGDDVTIATTDFAEPAQALEAITHALNEHHSLTLTQARYNREPDTNAVVINLTNVSQSAYPAKTAPPQANTSNPTGSPLNPYRSQSPSAELPPQPDNSGCDDPSSGGGRGLLAGHQASFT
jgi:hypothetical protein